MLFCSTDLVSSQHPQFCILGTFCLTGFFSEEYICDRFLCISCLFFHIPSFVFTLFFFFGGSYLCFFVHHTFVYVCDSSSAFSFLFWPKFYMYLRKLYSLMLLKDKFLLYIYDCINPVKLCSIYVFSVLNRRCVYFIIKQERIRIFCSFCGFKDTANMISKTLCIHLLFNMIFALM